jgi:hypothetical protein
MNVLTQAVYDRLAGDATLAGLFTAYQGAPAIFTTDPAPGNAHLPYLVTAGAVAQAAFDTKVSRGRRVWRDVRCYAAADGSAVTVEAIAERVRALLHRYELPVPGFGMLVSRCAGPVVADEPDVYGRVLTVEFLLMEV